jgi:uncharacterized protein (DUF2461 family)
MGKLDLRERLKLSLAVANDDIRTPYGDHCRERDAIQAVRERYWTLKNRLASRMEREIARIERGV